MLGLREPIKKTLQLFPRELPSSTLGRRGRWIQRAAGKREQREEAGGHP